MSDATDPRRLFADYASGEISAARLREMEAAIRSDPELRREFIEYMNVDSALGDLAALSEAELSVLKSLDKDPQRVSEDSGSGESSLADASGPGAGSLSLPADVRTQRWRRVGLAVAAVAASLVVAAILWIANLDDAHGASVATLVTNVDAVLLSGGKPWRDHELPAGEYELDQGLLHLRFDGGVMVYVEAPARFEAVSAKRVALHGGRLSASVPPAGVGFAVTTAEAEVIDYGTEFSVEAQTGASEVHVFEGLVKVHSRQGGKDEAGSVDLRTWEAVRIENSHLSPVSIELAPERFIRNFDEPKRNYARSVKRLSPVAYYRMPIRDRGLIAEPPAYSGKVLTGEGVRPPHAKGVFAGGSLRVKANSTGRGGRVDSPPPLRTGQFSLVVFVYLESRAHDAVVATNMNEAEGSFTLSLDENGLPHVAVKTIDGPLTTVSSDHLLPLPPGAIWS